MNPRNLLLVAGAVAGFALGPQQALAHAEPESATPPIGGTVMEAPAQVEVVFSQEVLRQGDDSSITVIDASGANVTTGSSEVDDANRRIIRVGLQPDLANGVYTVQWRTASANDGDTASGSFIFTIAGAEPTPTSEETGESTSTATEEATEEPTSAPTVAVAGADGDSDDSGIPTWVIVLGVVGGIAVVGVAAGAVIFVRSG